MEVGLCSMRETPHTPAAQHLELSEDVHTEAFITSTEGRAIITVDHQGGDFLINPLKQEESEDEGFLHEGTSNSLSRVTPSDQLDEGFHMRQLKKEQPEDDKYLYCEDCRLFYINKCEVHGPALFVPDNAVPLGVPDRAKQTIPPGLVVQESSIPDAGLGVFNMGKTVPVGVHFGPYQGDLVDCEEAMNSGYSWV
ncbi:histone-lysine N-methyltransferase PRDM9-like isoform X2, partial [Tachysurus ichikawai]